MTSNKEWEPISIQMEIFIKVSGKTVSQTVKEIIFIKVVRLFIKATGKMEKNKVSDNQSYKIIMAIQGSGKITKNKVKAATYILTDKNMTDNG